MTVPRRIYLSLYWKGWVWEGVGDRTELQHIDPHSIGHNCFSLPFSWAAQPGDWRPSLSGTCSLIQHLLSNWSDPQLSIGGLRAPSAGCWLSLPLIVSNWSGLQNSQSGAWGLPLLSPTDWISCALCYIIVQRPPSSCGHHNCTHSTHPQSRL